MEIELRSLNLGEILDRTFQIYRARFLTFIGIASIGEAVDLLARLTQLAATRPLHLKHGTPTVVVTIGVAGFLVVGSLLVAFALLFAATNRAVTTLYLGKIPGVAQSYSEVRPHWFRYVCLNVLVCIIGAVPVLVPLLLLVGTLVMAPPHTTGTTALYVAEGFLLVLAIPFTVWLMLRYVLASQACVFEKIGVFRALKRSAFLCKGQRLRIVVLGLLAGTIQSLMTGLLILPAIPFAILSRGHMPLALSIYVLAIGFLANVLIFPIMAIGLTVCYLDARIQKEGFDVEWMLERSLAAERLSGTVSGNSTPATGDIGLA